MAGTADCEDITPPEDDADVSFVGSLTLLLHAHAGARVHYEGKLVYGDPRPRELVSKGSSASPRKRSLPCPEAHDSNTACDILMIDNTGPVIITLWEPLVHTWYATMGNPATPYIRPTNLRVAELSRTEWNGTCLTRIRVLHSTPSITLRAGTAFSRMAELISLYLT